MPTDQDHLLAAERSERFAEHLKSTEYLEWAVTALFYAVVHLGRAHVAKKGGVMVTSHRGFETNFLRVSGNRDLFKLYRRMKDESERARYDCVDYSLADVVRIEQSVYAPWKEQLAREAGGR